MLAQFFCSRFTHFVMKSFILHALLGLSFTSFALAAETPPAARNFVAVTFGNPRAVAVDQAGNLYVGDVSGGTLYKITPGGSVTVLGTGGPAISDPIGLAVDSQGTVFVADADEDAVYKFPAGRPAIALGKPAGSSAAPNFHTPTDVAVDAAGSVFVTDNGNNSILRIAPDGTVSTFAGRGGAAGTADGKGGDARFNTPRGIAADPKGNLYVADEGNSNIRKISPDGVVSTLAGANGPSGSTDGTGPAARFGAPRALTADAAGNVYVADTDNHAIRKITPGGVVTTLAGKAGESGMADGPGAAARFSEPRGIAVDADGNVFVADSGNGAIRLITPAGAVTTVAGAIQP
jgi:sugar lactone lactonase YvrE